MEMACDNKAPLISVVIPITRYESELNEALVSVFSQTEQNFEVVLVDNHATKGTRSIAEDWELKHPEKIRLVFEAKKGLVSARNKGISESRGQFICFLDSDDRMKADRLAIQLKTLQSDPSIILVGSWTDEISPDGKMILGKNSNPKIPRWANILFAKQDRWKKDPFYEPRPSTFFMRTSVCKEELFDERFDPFWLEDTDFSFRMYERGRVVIVPQSLVEYRVHPKADSIRRIFDFGLILKHDVFFSILKEKYYLKDNSDSRSAFSKLKSRWLRETGIKVLAYQDGERYGKELIRKSLFENPSDIQNWESFLRSRLIRSFYPRAFGVKGPIDAVLPEYVDDAWVSNLLSLDR
ncbi:MAG: glycosyltransferase family 2 protein [Leptospirillum sp.]|jgi:glycosyltransferase involved in cell wall biosynthesis